MQTLNMILGERRRPKLTVTAPEPFTIHSAAYSLVSNGVEVVSGACEIINHDLFFVLEPAQRGNYTLTYTMEIAGEILKTRVFITVS